MSNFIIAEIGQAHEGSLGILHSYIEGLKNTGVHAVKFQTHIAEAESSQFEPFRVKFSYEDKTRFDYWRRMEFTPEQWVGIKQHCEEAGLEFISSPFSNAAIELLEKLGVKRYKVGSGEVTNFLLLDTLKKTGKPIMLSSGMSNFEELDRAFELFNNSGTLLSVLQCTTSYPTSPEDWGLNVIQELKNRYQVPVGFSDHSGDIFACLAAKASGAEIFEFHAVFDKRMFGPDTKSSLTLDEITRLCSGLNQLDSALQSPIDKSDNSKFKALKEIFEKSLSVNKSLKEGTVLKESDLEAKKPKGYGIPAHLYKDVVGKVLVKDLNQWDFLNFTDLK